MAKNVI